MTTFWRCNGFVLAFGFLFASVPAQALDTIDLGNVAPATAPGVRTLPFDVPLLDDGAVFFHEYLFDIDGPGPLEMSMDFLAEPLAGTSLAIPLAIFFSEWSGTGYSVVTFGGLSGEFSFSIPVENGPAPGAFSGRRYRISVEGTAPADITSGYQAVLTITAVPEPSTVAFLMAGLGVTGGVLARRRPSRTARLHT